MEKNVHQVERIARVLLGLFLILMAVSGERSPWLFLGIIPLLTGLFAWCPLYRLFGFSTCKVKKT